MAIKGVISDLDGTLVRFPIDYDKVYSSLQKLFDTNIEFKPLIKTIVELAKENNQKIQKAFSLICQEELKAAKNLTVIEGSTNFITSVIRNNIPLAVVTMQCREAALIALEKINSEKTIHTMVTRDDAYDREDQIRSVVKDLDLDPKDVLVVGDRIHDMNSARIIGCKSVLVNRNVSSDFETIQSIKDLDLKKFF